MQTKMKMKKKIDKSSDYGLKLNFEENQQVKKKKKKSAWVGGGEAQCGLSVSGASAHKRENIK